MRRKIITFSSLCALSLCFFSYICISLTKKGVIMRIVVLTGAGMSAESGISTFRDNGGLWDRYNVEDVATPEGWARDPKLVTDFYNTRRKELLGTKPCLGHELVAKLEEHHAVTVVTQNVDDLHERAGSTNVIHVHGNLTKVCSTKSPHDPRFVEDYPLTEPIRLGDKAGDGSQLRPYTVLFGERALRMEEAQEAALHADVFVVVGTSLAVMPAADLVRYVYKEVPKFVIDPKEVMACEAVGFEAIRATAGEGMAYLVERIKKGEVNIGIKACN